MRWLTLLRKNKCEDIDEKTVKSLRGKNQMLAAREAPGNISILPTSDQALANLRAEISRGRCKNYHSYYDRQIGDVGERMGLTRKMSTTAWKNLRDRLHPNQPTKDAKGKTIQYWCLGDICPDEYVILGDWDVLGNLPPRKRQKLKEETVKKSTPLTKTTTPLAASATPTSLPKDAAV
ncbi:hypothetical protein HO133_006201 [Letharia lupina]|uniref:Uncharacterized protein n=1 Tax=Letharia lupina TaxID=560253 RepID=A0A8H6F7N2_9LECA|nr:uncharacterized protein HO133_006201 [Letharia lupina]KAF6218240.1 hypothetical protein HO133_006201 [Letharia lupina]